MNITESIYCVSLNLDLNDFDYITKSMLDIYVFKDDSENIILYLSEEINMYNEWSKIKFEIMKNFK